MNAFVEGAATDPDEVGSLARQLAASYHQMVEFYQNEMKLPGSEADMRARGAMPDADPERDRHLAFEEPADQVHWWTISRLAERDPDAALAAWERIKVEAANELATGHRTARALEWGDRPWDRARFLAILSAFERQWEPRGGIEAALIDVLAQSFAEFLEWAEISTVRSEAEADTEERSIKRGGYWGPPRVAIAEAMSDAAQRVERAHRRFLVTLRAMQDLRRPSAVSIGHAEQVNVGGQQIVVASPFVANGAGDESGAE